MDDGESRKMGFHDRAEPLNTFDFAIESAVSDGKKQAFRHPIARGLSPVSCYLRVEGLRNNARQTLYVSILVVPAP